MDTCRFSLRGLRAWSVTSITLIVALAFHGRPVLAQAPPPKPGRDVVTSSGPFTEPQLAAIKNWADFWGGRIADTGSTAEQVEAGRDQLLDLVTTLNQPSAAFRFEYSKVLAPVLDPAIRTGSPHAAVNAMRVLSEVNGPRGLALLLGQLDAPDNRWQVRLWAAIGTRNALSPGILEPRTVTDAVRKLADSARNEANPLILRYKLEAIAVADQPNLNPAEAQQVRLKLVDAINDAVNRIAADPKAAPAMLDAVRAATVRLRNTFIGGKLAVAEQKEIGERIGPALGKILVIANDNWQAVQADPSTAQIYGNFVQVCEEFLKRIDGYVRGPDHTPKTQLATSWTGKQKEQFDAAAKQWNEVVTKAPYKP